MKIFHTSSTLFFFLLPAIAVAHDDVKVKGIQIIAVGEDCKTGNLPDQAKEGELLRNPNVDGDQRCARTLLPPDNSWKYLLDITYTF